MRSRHNKDIQNTRDKRSTNLVYYNNNECIYTISYIDDEKDPAARDDDRSRWAFYLYLKKK